MARRLRFIPEGGALVEVTCRTIQGRYLLRPSRQLRSIVIGVLARAQRLYSVELHAFVFLSNHYHLLMSVEDAEQMARFMNYLNSNLAREVGRLHHWREKFWGRRYQAILVSDEEAAQMNRLRYLLSHGCKEGLVSRPEEWPGAHCVRALVEGQGLEGLWIDRTRKCTSRMRGKRGRRSSFTSVESIHLRPLPCWAHLSTDDIRMRIKSIMDEIEKATAEVHAQEGSEPLGVHAVLKQHPHDRPDRLKKTSAPLFHAETRRVRKELMAAYSWFVAAYREAAKRLADGNRNTKFPAGSFPSRLPFESWTAGLAPG